MARVVSPHHVSLADTVPALLAGLGVTGMSNTFDIPRVSRVCLLLVDGLGWHLLRDHGAAAPFLYALSTGREPIVAGFPSTTATSVATLGTGVLSGEHGLVGYSFAVDGDLLNALSWRRHANGRPVDLRTRVVPEVIQPRRTLFERAVDAGVAVELVAPPGQDGSGLTRAALRGGHFRSAFALGDLTSHVLSSLAGHDRVFCYTYCPDLDALGHGYGPGSDAWVHQLTYVDHLVSTLADALPPDGLLAVTADHGMVTVGIEDRVDFDSEPMLHGGIRQLGGEARVRHLYVEPGATQDVCQAWRERLGDRALVLTRDEAIDAGWFGPRTADFVVPRIGDLVVAARGTLAVTRSKAEPRLSGFAGQHGSLTDHEQLIPFLTTTTRSRSDR